MRHSTATLTRYVTPATVPEHVPRWPGCAVMVSRWLWAQECPVTSGEVQTAFGLRSRRAAVRLMAAMRERGLALRLGCDGNHGPYLWVGGRPATFVDTLPSRQRRVLEVLEGGAMSYRELVLASGATSERRTCATTRERPVLQRRLTSRSTHITEGYIA